LIVTDGYAAILLDLSLNIRVVSEHCFVLISLPLFFESALRSLCAMEFDLGSIVLADIEHQLLLNMDVTVELAPLLHSDTKSPPTLGSVDSGGTWVEPANGFCIDFYVHWEGLTEIEEQTGPRFLESLGRALRDKEVRIPSQMAKLQLIVFCSFGII